MNEISLVPLGFLLLVAAVSSPSEGFKLACPPSDKIMIYHQQDVSPDMTPFIGIMRSGALQEFSDWVDSNFGWRKRGLRSFTDKLDVCTKPEQSFGSASIVSPYNVMETNVGSNTPVRGVMDAIVHAAITYWDDSYSYPHIIMVYTNKEPRYPPTPGFSPFVQNKINCKTFDTPSMAEFTTFMTKNKYNDINYMSIVFVVPDSLVNSYRSAFGWLGSRLSVVPSGSDKATLLNGGLYPAMNEIFCGIPPTTPPTTPTPVSSTSPTTTETTAVDHSTVMASTTAQSCAADTVLQLLHLQDFSWSYTNDMEHLKVKMPALLAGLEDEYLFRGVALGTFVDKAMAESGYPTDYCYREDSTFSTDGSIFINALNAATVGSGRDWRESQYDAIRDGLQSTTLGWWPGKSIEGKHLLRVVMLATDSAPHTKGDQSGLPPTSSAGCAFADYPSHADIKALLETYDVYPIFVVTNDMYNYYNHLLNNKINTTGKVLRLADPVTDIIDAVKVALEDLCNDSRR